MVTKLHGPPGTPMNPDGYEFEGILKAPCCDKPRPPSRIPKTWNPSFRVRGLRFRGSGFRGLRFGGFRFTGLRCRDFRFRGVRFTGLRFGGLRLQV